MVAACALSKIPQPYAASLHSVVEGPSVRSPIVREGWLCPALCGILNMDFAELPFYEVG